MHLNEHRPISVGAALGLALPEPPEPEEIEDLLAEAPAEPKQIVQGLVHQGCKMVLAGTSKSSKSWCLIDLALSVASGAPWWGLPTTKSPVLYINFELPRWALRRRVETLAVARPEVRGFRGRLTTWNLRGAIGDLRWLEPRLTTLLDAKDYGLVILDPAYKLLGDRDENSNGDISSLMNDFERLAGMTGASVVVAHHFAKGDPTSKDPMDRMSGAGAWARDPDSILVLTPHEEPDCFSVCSILRHLPALPEFVVAWDWPLMRPAQGLDPSQLRRKFGRPKRMTDTEFAESFIGHMPQSPAAIIAQASSKGFGASTVFRYLHRLVVAGGIRKANGLYWLPDGPVTPA